MKIRYKALATVLRALTQGQQLLAEIEENEYVLQKLETNYKEMDFALLKDGN